MSLYSGDMYKGLTMCGGSFMKFNWETDKFIYDLDENIILEKKNSIWKLNDSNIPDSVAQNLFESKIYPQFLHDKEKIDVWQEKIDERMAKYR